MDIKNKKKNIIQAGYKAVDELIKVAKEPIVDTEDDVSADRLKNAAATKKLAILDAFEILNRIEEENSILENILSLYQKLVKLVKYMKYKIYVLLYLNPKAYVKSIISGIKKYIQKS